MDIFTILVGAFAIHFIVGAIFGWREEDRRLAEKYPDPEIRAAIQSGKIWQGMTEEQLIDSLGKPAAMRARRRSEIYKYGPTGGGEYRLHVTVEKGRVVAWDQR